MSKLGSVSLAAGAMAAMLASGVGAVEVVIGPALAERCQEAATGRLRGADTLDVCNRALREQVLFGHNLAATHVNRGVVLVYRGDYAAARDDFQRAIEIEPKLGEAYVNRGIAQLRMGELQAAVADIDRGLALGVAAPERAYFNRAQAREGLSDVQGAYRDYRRAAELRPEWDSPRRHLERFRLVRR